MARGSGGHNMTPGRESFRPTDEHHEEDRGAGTQHGADYDPPQGSATPKGSHKFPKGSGSVKADFSAELHDMSGHLGHHSSGSAHKDAFSGGGKNHSSHRR